MPLSRYLIKNEYGLADPELYRAADKDDPEALLEGVAMAGLVGLLRQLGDLAEFAAEIFHELHEEVMATASRGHGLLVRVQQLESEFPSIEMTLLSQTSHSSLLDNSGSEWHHNLRMEQNLITQGDLPRFVMDSYEECRAPPRLFILDKFDVAGAGACLKRYTDPSYFKVGLENPENHREKKRKAKKKGSQVKNGDNTLQAQPKVHTRLHDLLHKETVENIINGPTSRVKLKKRLNENKLEQSYMEKFLKINAAGPEEVVREISVSSAPQLPCNGSPRQELSPKRSSYSSSSDIDDSLVKPPIDQLTEEAKYELSGVKRQFSSETYETFSPLHNHVDEKEIEVDSERKKRSTTGDYQSDDIASDVDNYMDALATIDSDIESDMLCRSKNDIFSSKQQPDINSNQADLPDPHPVESFILTDNESISSSGELSELSYSDNSNLTKAVLSDDSVSAEGIQSSDLSRVEDDHLLSELPLVDENNTTPHLDNIGNDIYAIEADTSTYSCGIGEEQSSSCHTDTHPVSVSLNLQGILKEDPSENSESNEEGSINNENSEYPPHDLLLASKISDIPSEAVQTLLSVSMAENHLEYQDQIDTSPILRKTLESEKNNDVDFTENATKGELHTSYMETMAFKAPDFVDTIAAEPVTYSFDLHMDPSHLNNFRIGEQPESFVALREKQPETFVLFEEHTELVIPHSEEPQITVSHEQDQFAVSHADEQSQLLLLHTGKHNQSVISDKEEKTPLDVSDIEKQLAEEQTQWKLREEENPQLSPSQAAEQTQSTSSDKEEQLQSMASSDKEGQLQSMTSSDKEEKLQSMTSSDKEEQLQSITSHTEETPISIASCAELQSQPLSLTVPCVVLREHDTIVIPEVIVSSEFSPSIRCLTNDSMEQTSVESTEVISPVEPQLPSMDNLKDNVSEADCREHDSFIDRTTSVQHEFHSDTLNSEEVSNEYVPLFDEGTETKQSKATSEVSAACLMDDIYLAEEQDLSVVEESTSIVGPLHPVIEMEHSLRPLDKALLEERSQQTGMETGLETGTRTGLDDIYLVEEQNLSVVVESTSIVEPLHPVIEMEHSLRPLDKVLLEERSQQTGTRTGLETGAGTGTGLDDIYLVEEQDLSVVEETSIVGPHHPVIEMEHSLRPLDKALLEDKSQQTGTRTGLETGTGTGLDDIYLVEEQDLSVVEESTSIVGPHHPVIEMEHSLRPLDKALLEDRSQQTGTGTGLETVLCNTVSNIESDTGIPADINEIMKTSEITTLEQSGLDSASNSQMETPIGHKVLQIVEQFEKELKSAEKVSQEAYFHKKQSTTPDCLYLEEQPSGSPKFAEVPMSEFSKPNHFGYVESQPVGQSMPMSTFFPVKAIESPNFLDQEDHSIASGPSMRSLSFLSPSNAHKDVRVPSIAIFPSFDLPGPSQNMFDEMPPLPPLPPVQWRIPKVLLQNAPEGLERNLEQLDVNPLTMSQSSANLTPQLDHEIRGESTRMQFSTLSAIKDEVSNHECNLSPVSPVVRNEHTEDFHIPDMAISSMAPPIPDDDDDRLRMTPNEEDSSLTNASKPLQEKSIEHLDGLAPENEKSLALNVTMEEVDPLETALTSTNMDDGKPQPVSSNSEDHSMFAPHPELPYIKSNGGFQKKLPRPRNPLIDAVVALDKTKLRKVTERIRPPSDQKVDERDTFLEQIRTRSFNLKPTSATRPSIQGPKTNRNVAAILEKANSIRQALAGSDDDDDNDSWSDS